MEHAFNVNVAKDFDISVATFLQNMKFWTLNNLANNKNMREGLCWTYNTIEALCELFPYFSRHQLEHLIEKCEGFGLLVSGNFNATKYDRTKWYALTPKAYDYYPELCEEHFIDRLHVSGKKDKKFHECYGSTISENSEIELVDFRNRFRKVPAPIPDTDPDTDPDINTIVDFDKSTSYKDDNLFMQFYSIYPNKQKPEVARKAFYKHKPTQEFVRMLCTDVTKRVENNWKNRHKSKIPFPATYLNGQEWEGEIIEPESTVSRLPDKSMIYDNNDTSWMDEVKFK
jgi:hypothetical protein